MESQKWSALQKNLFRFFFLFLALSSLVGYNMIVMILGIADNSADKAMSFLGKPVAWLDHHLFNIGFDAGKHATFYGDGYFGWAALTII